MIIWWDGVCPYCKSIAKKFTYRGKTYGEDTLFICNDCGRLFEVGEWGIMNFAQVWTLDKT